MEKKIISDKALIIEMINRYNINMLTEGIYDYYSVGRVAAKATLENSAVQLELDFGGVDFLAYRMEFLTGFFHYILEKTKQIPSKLVDKKIILALDDYDKHNEKIKDTLKWFAYNLEHILDIQEEQNIDYATLYNLVIV
ncbi:MAG: hypothetical protein PHV30_10890 [Candidatus Margulisbacteria bacterium]|nr:hypothetical protein [Candidatus Margulisiibacteriota bacterium]